MTEQTPNTSPPLIRSELAELKALIAASSDRELLPAEIERLQQILATHQEARSLYIGCMQLDSNLDWKIRGSQSVDTIVQRSRDAASLMSELDRVEQPHRPALARRRLFALLAVAASLCFVSASIAWLWPADAHDNNDVAAAQIVT